MSVCCTGGQIVRHRVHSYSMHIIHTYTHRTLGHIHFWTGGAWTWSVRHFRWRGSDPFRTRAWVWLMENSVAKNRPVTNVENVDVSCSRAPLSILIAQLRECRFKDVREIWKFIRKKKHSYRAHVLVCTILHTDSLERRTIIPDIGVRDGGDTCPPPTKKQTNKKNRKNIFRGIVM